MKQNGVWFVCLVLASLLAFPVVSQTANTANIESVIVDSFDTPESMDWTWNASASRFIMEGYPKLQFFDGIPLGLRLPGQSPEDVRKILGVEVSYARKGDNWFEIYPQAQDENGELAPYEPDFFGNVKSVDMWVWGANYDYALHIMIRDAEGKVFTFPVTRLNFDGWQYFSVKIPHTLKQKSRYRSGRPNLSFVGFRVTTAAAAPVDNFVIFLDQLKYITNTYDEHFDGYEVQDFVFEDEESAQ